MILSAQHTNDKMAQRYPESKHPYHDAKHLMDVFQCPLEGLFGHGQPNCGTLSSATSVPSVEFLLIPTLPPQVPKRQGPAPPGDAWRHWQPAT